MRRLASPRRHSTVLLPKTLVLATVMAAALAAGSGHGQATLEAHRVPSCCMALAPPPLPAPTEEEACFAPEEHCGALAVKEVAKALHTVRVQAYSFTLRALAQALAAARQRGVDVKVIMDAKEARGSDRALQILLSAGIPVRLDGVHAIAHNKVIVIDDSEVLTGSFNFTTAADRRNAENLLVLRGDPALARAYLANWERHWGHSSDARSFPAAGGARP